MALPLFHKAGEPAVFRSNVKGVILPLGLKRTIGVPAVIRTGRDLAAEKERLDFTGEFPGQDNGFFLRYMRVIYRKETAPQQIFDKAICTKQHPLRQTAGDGNFTAVDFNAVFFCIQRRIALDGYDFFSAGISMDGFKFEFADFFNICSYML